MRYIVVDGGGDWMEINGVVTIQKIEDHQLAALQDSHGTALDEDEGLPGTWVATLTTSYAASEPDDTLELSVAGDVSFLGPLIPV